ncbi:MAG: carboxypeptidase regulatory-like domain-containing protein [Bacteroidota bacterium]|nr:MAG: carboxypeptidase regulatory-like domain-containing protein [Bacteroidota bacterium]
MIEYYSNPLYLMMRFWVFLWCVLCGSEHLCAQNYAIEGRVVDAAKGTRLVKCRVELMSLSDTTYFQDETNLYGNFYIGRIPAPGKYLLVVSQVGYARYAKAIELREPYQKLDPIRMEDSLYVLNETKVKAKRDALIQKGDTLRFKRNNTRPTRIWMPFIFK